jgi:hypothetical protein
MVGLEEAVPIEPLETTPRQQDPDDGDEAKGAQKTSREGHRREAYSVLRYSKSAVRSEAESASAKVWQALE